MKEIISNVAAKDSTARLTPITTNFFRSAQNSCSSSPTRMSASLSREKGELGETKALKVACVQEAQYRSPQQLTNIPHSFARARPSCEAMDQANDIKLIRHGRELATDGVQRKEESAIKHEPENPPKD